VQYVSTANGIACNHGNDWLGQPPYLDLHAFRICWHSLFDTELEPFDVATSQVLLILTA
jgi:hypothetical protein